MVVSNFFKEKWKDYMIFDKQSIMIFGPFAFCYNFFKGNVVSFECLFFSALAVVFVGLTDLFIIILAQYLVRNVPSITGQSDEERY